MAELQGHLDDCRTYRGQMNAALTALRLVAPSDVVTAAQAAHDSCHHLIDLAMGQREPNVDDETSDEHWEQLKIAAGQDRSDLVIAVRRAFGIESDAVPFGAGADSSWTIPADRSSPPPTLTDRSVGSGSQHQRPAKTTRLGSRPNPQALAARDPPGRRQDRVPHRAIQIHPQS